MVNDKPKMCAFCFAEEPHTPTFKGRVPETGERKRACKACGLERKMWLSQAEMRRMR